MWTSDRRLYLNADKTAVVEEGDPEAAFLLVGEGGELTEDEARSYGLLKSRKGAPSADAAAGEDGEDEQEKAQPKPADKARRPAKNK